MNKQDQKVKEAIEKAEEFAKNFGLEFVLMSVNPPTGWMLHKFFGHILAALAYNGKYSTVYRTKDHSNHAWGIDSISRSGYLTVEEVPNSRARMVKYTKYPK